MASFELNSDQFWQQPNSAVFLNPKIQSQDKDWIAREIAKQDQASTIWLKSSGTESAKQYEHKLVALPKKAILQAAESVNRFFTVTSTDRWFNVLPSFHIGGLAIYARAHLAQTPVIETQSEKWNPHDFCRSIKEEKVTITSLVPTQVFDLVKCSLRPSNSLRLIIVGGGALRANIFKKARDLGWPIIPSYGMTETCALIAASPLSSLLKNEMEPMEILSHVQLVSNQERFRVCGDSLLSGFLLLQKEKTQWVQVKGELLLDDCLEMSGGKLKVLGRKSQIVKILGETVNIEKLEMDFTDYLFDVQREAHFFITAVEDPRRGFTLKLVSEKLNLSDELVHFNSTLLPFQRIQDYEVVEEIPRSALGKVLR